MKREVGGGRDEVEVYIGVSGLSMEKILVWRKVGVVEVERKGGGGFANEEEGGVGEEEETVLVEGESKRRWCE